MRVVFRIFSLGAAQTPVALSAQSARKAPKNPAKWVFLVVTILERFREYSKIVPLLVPQSSLLLSSVNFCKLAHTSTTEKSLENAAVLLQ